MKAVIIAGGRGERLRPLTDTTPKPMIDVNGKPVLEHVISLFKKHSITDFIITLHYLGEKIRSYFADGSRFSVKIKYIFEREPLGTAGGVRLAKKFIHETFLVTSGDILLDLDIKAMIDFHKKKKAFATLNVYKRYGPDPKSSILFNKENRISRFVERPEPQEIKGDFVFANGSFYIFEAEIFDFIPKNKPSDFGKDIFPKLLEAKKPLFAFPTGGYFIDIGNLEKLKKARNTFKT